MKLLKKILKTLMVVLTAITILLILFLAVSIGPLDRTPLQQYPQYAEMMRRLDGLKNIAIPPAKQNFSVGYSKQNLTPPFPTATAGYGKRKGKPFTSVHDSIYVRTLVIDNGTTRIAVVSADLLIIPPSVVKNLQGRLAAIGFSLDNTYLGATHTHNSIGNWGKGATRFLYGAYEDSVVNFISGTILKSIEQASKNLLPAKLLSGVIPIPEAVENRLIDDGPEDPLLRVIEVHRSDSSKLLLMSYTAHATCLYSADFSLSRDYPGKLVDAMEQKGYDFTMFMAGAVGSHTSNAPEAGASCIDWTTEKIVTAFEKSSNTLRPISDSVIWMKRVPLSLADPQIKLTDNLKARSWLFRAAFGEYPAYLTALRLGDLVMLGTPCDFSGEFDAAIDSFARKQNLRVMITSFNGGYIGYVTPSKYYDVEHYETQLMNWYPPGNGEYIRECLEKMLVAVSDK